MYRIMKCVKKSSTLGESLYQFDVTTVDGVTGYREFETDTALDQWVEQVLNDGTYSKSDFIAVEVKDYTVSADIAENVAE